MELFQQHFGSNSRYTMMELRERSFSISKLKNNDCFPFSFYNIVNKFQRACVVFSQLHTISYLRFCNDDKIPLVQFLLERTRLPVHTKNHLALYLFKVNS